MPFIDYTVDPSFLLSFAGLVLSVISAIFGVVRAVGPFGQLAIVLIPVALFMRNIYAGPQAFKHR